MNIEAGLALGIALVGTLVAALATRRVGWLTPIGIFTVVYTLGVPFRWGLLWAGAATPLAPWVVGPPTSQTLTLSLATSAFFQTLVVVSALLWIGMNPDERPRPARVQVRWSTDALVVVLAALSVAASLAYLILMSRHTSGGHLGAAVTALQSRVLGATAGAGHIALLIEIAIFANATVAILWAHSRTARRYLPKLVGLVGFLAAFVATVVSGARGLTVILIASVALGPAFLGLVRSRRLPRIRTVAAVVAVIAVVVLGLNVRIAVQGAEPRTRIWVTDILVGVANSMPLVDAHGLAIDYEREKGATFGENFLRIPSLVIPRGLWPAKPDAFGVEIRYTYWGDRLTGIPVGYLGEFIVAFGILGVLPAVAFFLIVLVLLQRFRRAGSRFPEAWGALYVIGSLQLAGNALRSGLEVSLLRLAVLAALATIWRLLLAPLTLPSATPRENSPSSTRGQLASVE
ncbi:MAG: hypothetical protein M3198_19800 [Actinomycetota bacterium]|nr:hypothetical protein [Actinomycetota bacterium]